MGMRSTDVSVTPVQTDLAVRRVDAGAGVGDRRQKGQEQATHSSSHDEQDQAPADQIELSEEYVREHPAEAHVEPAPEHGAERPPRRLDIEA